MIGIVEYHIEVDLNTEKNYKGHSIIKIIEVISEEEILEEHKITEVKIIEEWYRGSLWKNNFGRGKSRSRER